MVYERPEVQNTIKYLYCLIWFAFEDEAPILFQYRNHCNILICEFRIQAYEIAFSYVTVFFVTAKSLATSLDNLTC